MEISDLIDMTTPADRAIEPVLRELEACGSALQELEFYQGAFRASEHAIGHLNLQEPQELVFPNV